MGGLSSILSLFRNEFNKFYNTKAQMLDSLLKEKRYATDENIFLALLYDVLIQFLLEYAY